MMELRVQKFHADAEKCFKLGGDCRRFTFSDFSLQQNALIFKWTSLLTGNVCRITFLASEDYPDNSLITQLWEATGTEQSHVCCVTVNSLMQKIGDELLVAESMAKMDIESDRANVRNLGGGDAPLSDSEFSDCQSHLSDDTEDYDQSDYYDDLDNFPGMAEEYGKTGMAKVNPLLQADMQMLRDVYSDSCVSYRLLDSIGEIDVELKIPLTFLNLTTQMAKAWKLNIAEPLVIRIHLASVSYLDSPDCPKVEVFQASKKNVCGIAPQMKNILDLFLQQHWRELNNARLRTATSRSQSVPAELSSLAQSDSNMSASASACAADLDTEKVDDLSLAKLVEMGFQTNLARNALIITHGNLAEASILLSTNSLSGGDDEWEYIDLQEADDNKMSSAVDARPGPRPDASKSKGFPSLKSFTSGPAGNASKGTSRQLSHPHKSSGKKKADFGRSKSLSTSQTEPSLTLPDPPPQEDLLMQPTVTNVKSTPSLDNGFLVMLFRYARQRIPTLNEFCVVCDEPHVFQNGAMLMPAVCSRELCVFAYQTLGVMVDAAADIATGAEVVDLLVAMTKAAIASHRKAIIFDPFPNIVDPSNPKELAFTEKCKDYKKLEALIARLPPMKAMTSVTCGQLHAKLDNTDRLLFPLLTWIISSNRSHIVKLPPERQIKFMVTPHQFLLLSSPPAKEAAFQTAKEKYGSTFAFHGSSIENWHSIIRMGLIVASGTKRQVNGAAFGRGIYLSPLAHMSFNYSCMGYSRHHVGKGGKTKDKPEKARFLCSQNLNCIALCEVIRSPQLRINKDIWVCPDADHVCTRFFFVYEDGQVGDNNIDMKKEEYKQIVQQAMSNIVKS